MNVLPLHYFNCTLQTSFHHKMAYIQYIQKTITSLIHNTLHSCSYTTTCAAANLAIGTL